MKKLIKHFIFYNIIGVSGALLDFFVYISLNSITSIDYRIINAFSVFMGITNNFYWNYKYNFRTLGNVARRYISFLTIGSFGLLISTIVLTLMVDRIGLGLISAKVVTVFFVAVLQFILNKTITFRKVS